VRRRAQGISQGYGARSFLASLPRFAVNQSERKSTPQSDRYAVTQKHKTASASGARGKAALHRIGQRVSIHRRQGQALRALRGLDRTGAGAVRRTAGG